MKKYKMLSCSAAVLLAAALLWYGTILLKANSRPPVLVDAAGEASALEGITLEGMVVDQAHTQSFTLKDGKISARTDANPQNFFVGQQHYFCNIDIYPAGQLSQPQLVEQDEVSQRWQISAQKVHLYAHILWKKDGFKYHSAVIDTGIELPCEDILFFRMANADASHAGKWNLADANAFWENVLPDNMNSAMTQIGDSVYVALDLPAGGVNIYKIEKRASEWELENTVLEEESRREETRNAEDMTVVPENLIESRLVRSLTSAEMLSVTQMLPVGENLLIIGQTYNQSAKQVNINAWLCNQEFKVLGTVNLAQLPASEDYLEEREKYYPNVIPSAQPGEDENTFKLIIDIYHPAFNGDVQHMAAVISTENGLTAQKYAFPGEAYSDGLPLELLTEEPRDILAVQTDAAGEKAAILYGRIQKQGQKPDKNLYLDVWQGKNLMYTGTLQSDWMDDNHTKLVSLSPIWGSSWQRYYRFPVRNDIAGNVQDLTWYQPMLDAYGNIS